MTCAESHVPGPGYRSSRLRFALAAVPTALLAAGLACATVPAAAAAAPEVTLTYLANEGFLIRSGETLVLVDALFGDGIRGYPAVPPTIRGELEAASGRFAGVDLILASHGHADHFSANAVARHLRANPDAVFVSPPQAAAELDELLGAAAGSFHRVSPYPAEGATARVQVPGVTVTVLNLHHGRRLGVENVGFLIEIGGLKLLHVGDTEAGAEVFGAYGLDAVGIDVALLPGWLLAEPRWRGVAGERIRPRQVVAMHLAAREAPASWFGSAGSLESRVAQIREAFPGAWVPLEPLASKSFRAGDPLPDPPPAGDPL